MLLPDARFVHGVPTTIVYASITSIFYSDYSTVIFRCYLMGLRCIYGCLDGCRDVESAQLSPGVEDRSQKKSRQQYVKLLKLDLSDCTAPSNWHAEKSSRNDMDW